MIKLKEFLDDEKQHKDNFYIYYDEHYNEKLLVHEEINKNILKRKINIMNIEYLKELIKEADNIPEEFIKEKIKENESIDLLEDESEEYEDE